MNHFLKLLLLIILTPILSVIVYFTVYILVTVACCKEWKTVEYYLGASQFNKAQAVKETVCIKYILEEI